MPPRGQAKGHRPAANGVRNAVANLWKLVNEAATVLMKIAYHEPPTEAMEKALLPCLRG